MGHGSFALPDDAKRVVIGRVASDAFLELGSQLVGRPHSKIRIVYGDAPRRVSLDGSIERLESPSKQRIVVPQSAPSLTVIAVGDVKLNARIAFCRIGAVERRAGSLEVVGPKQAEPFLEARLVNLIRVETRRDSACDFSERGRTRGIEPDDEGRVD
jgi:hypothetical protein